MLLSYCDFKTHLINKEKLCGTFFVQLFPSVRVQPEVEYSLENWQQRAKDRHIILDVVAVEIMPTYCDTIEKQ